MPQSALSRERLESLVGTRLPDARLEDLLFASKGELAGSDGDTITVSVTPDRLDLLCEGGLATFLGGPLETARGVPPIERAGPRGTPPSFRVDRSVEPIRPAIAGALVRAPDGTALDAGLLDEAIRFQELLHATLGRDRRSASLGIYPSEMVEPPVRYGLEPLEGVSFVPLGGDVEILAETFFTQHPMAARYGPLGRDGARCLVLRDARGVVLSLPPVLNGRVAGEARVGQRELLLEATGRDARTVREAVGLLLVVFVARGWSVGPVAVEGPGEHQDDGLATVQARTLRLPSDLVRAVVGEPLPAPEVSHRLARCRLSARTHAHGWDVEVPPWRPDLLAPVDLVEEIYLAAAVRPEDGLVPPSTSLGRLRAETRFRRRTATRLLGLGFSAPYTTLLLSSSTVAEVGGPEPIRIRNPVSAEYAFVRDRILLSHLDVLARNTRHRYPQRFAEVGPVVVRSPTAESGGETRYRASLMVADDATGFAEAAALVEYLLRDVDASGVREPAELPGTIPGRAARVRVAGEPVAEIGEIHPRILTRLGVPVPVAWAEVDLTALWPLVARHEGP